MQTGTAGRSTLIALVLVLVALGLRLYRIDYQSFWVDEGYSVAMSSVPLHTILETVAPDHTPFYYALLHLWTLAAGRSELSVRFLSTILGVLLVALVYRAGHEWFGSRVAALAALIAALSPFLVYYSQEGRMHVQATLFGLLSAVLLVRAAKNNTFSAWAAYLLAAVAAVYSFYYAALLLLAEGAFLLISNDRRALYRWLAVMVSVLAALAPWLVYDIPRFMAYVGPRTRGLEALPLDRFAVEVWLSAVLGSVDDRTILCLATLPLLLPLGAAAIGVSRPRQFRSSSGHGNAGLLCLVFCLLPFAIAYATNLVVPHFQTRYLLLAAPYLYLLAAAGFVDLASVDSSSRATLLRRTAAVGIAVCTVALFAIALWHQYFDPGYARDDYRSLVARIERETPDDSAVVLNGPWQIDTYAYYQKMPLTIVGAPEFNASRQEVTSTLQRTLAEHPVLWLVSYGNASADPDSMVESWLDDHAYKLVEQWYGQTRLVKYLGRVPDNFNPSVAPNSIRYHFAEDLALIGYQARLSTASMKAVIVDLYWQALGSGREDYTAFVHLIDGTGVVRAQSDGMPLGPEQPTSRWKPGEIVHEKRRIDLPADLKAGVYPIEVGLYRAADGSRPNVRTEKGRFLGNRLILETIDVSTCHDNACETMRTSWDVSFGDRLVLQSSATSAIPTRPGETVLLAVQWQALRDIEDDYTMFVHMVDRTGKLVAQVDTQPGNGFKPTSAWPVGSAVTDRLALRIPANTPVGAYALCAGLYNLATMRRLPVAATHNEPACGADTLQIDRILVTPTVP